MKVSSLILSAAAALVWVAPVAKAANVFADADAAYAQRENNHAQIAAARAAYLNQLNTNPNLTKVQKIYAVAQLGRLAVYEGEQLTPASDTATRKQIFSDCWDPSSTAGGYVKYADPAVVGDNPVFYFYKGICMAYWGEVVSPILAIPQLPVLNDLIAKGKVGSNADFEGGGIWRLAAGVHSNPKAQLIPGAYDIEGAKTETANALASPGLKYLSNEQISGAQFYENWRIKGTVFVQAGDNATAREAYQQGIAQAQGDLANGTAPKSRIPESHYMLNLMQSELAALPAN